MQSLLGFANFCRQFILTRTVVPGTKSSKITNQRHTRQAKTLSEFDFQIVAWGEKWEELSPVDWTPSLKGGVRTSTW